MNLLGRQPELKAVFFKETPQTGDNVSRRCITVKVPGQCLPFIFQAEINSSVSEFILPVSRTDSFFSGIRVCSGAKVMKSASEWTQNRRDLFPQRSTEDGYPECFAAAWFRFIVWQSRSPESGSFNELWPASNVFLVFFPHLIL